MSLFDPITQSKRLKAGQVCGLCPLPYVADNKPISKLMLCKYSAFCRLKGVTSVFQVLWRYDGVVPENAPKNVKLMKWLPQNELLGASHPVPETLPSRLNVVTNVCLVHSVPQPTPKLRSSSLTGAPTASTRASATACQC